MHGWWEQISSRGGHPRNLCHGHNEGQAFSLGQTVGGQRSKITLNRLRKNEMQKFTKVEKK
jgi:hypothetical protein